jgi:hypothetical protein
VTFNGIPATSFSIVDNAHVTAYSPLSPTLGAVAVRVINPSATSPVVAADKFTYTAPPPPKITSLSLSAGPTSGGQTVTLTGSNLVGVSKVTLGSTVVPSSKFTAISAPTTVTFKTPAEPAGQVMVSVTTPGGTSTGTPYRFDSAPTISSVTPCAGLPAGGQTVTISGSNLAGATQVTFGGVVVAAASFTSDTTSKIVLAAPPHAAGPVVVTVVTPGGSAGAGSFTYEGAPSVTGVSPASVLHHQVVTVTVTGANLVGATKVMVGATAATAIVVVSGTKLTFSTPLLAVGTYDVVVTTPSGTSSTVPVDKLKST